MESNLIRVLLSGLELIVVVVSFGFLFIGARRRLVVRADREHHMVLTNGGNCRSVFRLKIVSPRPELVFTFFRRNTPLVEQNNVERKNASESITPEAEPESPALLPGEHITQTPEVLPGEDLHLTLRIGKRGARYPEGSFPYTLQAEQLTVDFPDLAVPPVIKEGIVYFEPKEEWRYWALPIVTIALVLLAVTILAYSYLRLWSPVYN